MGIINIEKFLAKYLKGEAGEEIVIKSLISILQHSNENYYLIPKAKFQNTNIIYEIDILLIHPMLGIYIIEVKNWKSLDNIDENNSPFNQASKYKNIILSMLNENFNRTPINVEMRAIFPNISKSDASNYFDKNKYYANMDIVSFFKEDLQDKNSFKHFFKSTTRVIPSHDDFIKLSALLVPTKIIQNNDVIPVITKDEILFFDNKQLSALNGYNGDFRIVRGVAGTGKTIILINFVNQILGKNLDKTFLILCFNKNLENEIKNSFDTQNSNIKVMSILSFLWKIGFPFFEVGIHKNTTIDEQYKIFESNQALIKFNECLIKYLQTQNIDFVLCDETQDMPSGFMRLLYERIKNCIFFIDEAQKFYPFTMNSIADIFHHPKFKNKVFMKGKIENLYNVYRTPSNIATCALEILNKDINLNNYYKNTAFYLKNDLLSDINCILQSGNIDLIYKDEIFEIIKNLPLNDDSIILVYNKLNLEEIQSKLNMLKRTDIKVMTMQGIKGLEAQNIILYRFVNFANMIFNNQKELLYKQIYTLLTRARENLYIDITNEPQSKEIAEILDIIKSYANQSKEIKSIEQKPDNKEFELNLAKIRPILDDAKENLKSAASEIFLAVSRLFSKS